MKKNNKEPLPLGDHKKWFLSSLDAYVAKKKLKQTRQRVLIADFLFTMKKHIDADELHRTMQNAGLDLGLATVYRTLNLFREAGILEQKYFADGRQTYEIASPEHHHDHIICLDCNQVFEFENKKIEQLQEQIAENMGFKLASHRLDLFGHCSKKNCSNLPKTKKN